MHCSKRLFLRHIVSAITLYVAVGGAHEQGFAQPGDGVQGQSGNMAVSAADWAKKYPEVFEGIEKFNARDIAAALKDFEEATQKYPELPPAELMLADLYIEKNRVEMAVNALDTAARKYPEDPETFLLLGNLAFQENRNTDASLAFDKARELL